MNLFSLATMTTYASPWNCLQNWIQNNQSLLTEHKVDFQHDDLILTEAYSFRMNPNDPFFECHDQKKSAWFMCAQKDKITKDWATQINLATKACNCSHPWDTGIYPEKMSGLCGHW